VTQAVLFNKTENREVLMPGLLPGSDDARETKKKARELAAMIAGDDEMPSVYEPLFGSLNSGMPVEKADVARRVVDAYRSEIDRAGGDAGDMDEDEMEALNERMKGHRFGVLSRRAEEISVYASMEALRGADPLSYSDVPSDVPSGSLDERDALRWQMDYWLVQDMLRAVDLANRTDDGLATEVPRSPVKRIVSIRLEQIDIPEKPAEAVAAAPADPKPRTRTMLAPPVAPARSILGGNAPGTPRVTHTGRKNEDKNGVYIVRHATITVVASSDEIVSVLESFGAANFMTVTGVGLSEVDRWADMDEGFYYGPDHVVRAEIDIEAAYLNFWLADVLPEYVASSWGVEKPVTQTDAVP